jgi:hypothetical protein
MSTVSTLKPQVQFNLRPVTTTAILDDGTEVKCSGIEVCAGCGTAFVASDTDINGNGELIRDCRCCFLGAFSIRLR